MRTHGWVLATLFLSPLLLAKEIDPVVVELRSEVPSTSRWVTVGDVADLSGGTSALRQKMAHLDLAEQTANGETIRITKKQVEFRLRLADINKQQFKLIGAEEVLIAPQRHALNEETITKIATENLQKLLPFAADEVSIRLLQPISVKLPSVTDPEDVRIKAVAHSSQVSLGRCQMDVTIYVRGEKKISFPVFLESLLLQEVAIARQTLSKGETLTESNVVIRKQPVNPNNKQTLLGSSVLNRKVKQTIKAGQILQTTDLEETAPENPTLVKAKQPVKMVVRLGTMNIIAVGEAQQDGRLDQLIRVQNVDSKKTIVARVTGAGIVEVDTGGIP